MRSACLVVGTVILGISACLGAEHSWTGKISDSMCGAQHKAAGEHSASNLSDVDCTAACARKGAKYVFVTSGKVYKIDNQDVAGLSKHAGQTIRLSGEMTGDSIRVSKIGATAKEHQGEKSSLD